MRLRSDDVGPAQNKKALENKSTLSRVPICSHFDSGDKVIAPTQGLALQWVAEIQRGGLVAVADVGHVDTKPAHDDMVNTAPCTYTPALRPVQTDEVARRPCLSRRRQESFERDAVAREQRTSVLACSSTYHTQRIGRWLIVSGVLQQQPCVG